MESCWLVEVVEVVVVVVGGGRQWVCCEGTRPTHTQTHTHTKRKMVVWLATKQQKDSDRHRTHEGNIRVRLPHQFAMERRTMT